jgi:hypothetical protein
LYNFCIVSVSLIVASRMLTTVTFWDRAMWSFVCSYQLNYISISDSSKSSHCLKIEIIMCSISIGSLFSSVGAGGTFYETIIINFSY